MTQVDEKLQINDLLVQAMIEQNIFPASEDASLSAPAPTEAEHEVHGRRDGRVTFRVDSAFTAPSEYSAAVRPRLVGLGEGGAAVWHATAADSQSLQGKGERDTAYQPILEALEAQYSNYDASQR